MGPDGELAVRITPASASSIRYDEGVELIAVSLDDGETWALRAAPGTDERGELAATWFSGIGDDLRAHVGLIRPGGDGRVSISSSDPLEVDAWAVSGERRVREPAGEYFPAAFLSGGDLGVLLPIQAAESGDGFSWIRISR